VLTADLVHVRRRGGELQLVKLADDARMRASRLAALLVAVYQGGVGGTRDEIAAQVAAVEAAPRDQRLKAGLVKLLDDRATWSITGDLDPETARRETFTRATAVRASLGAGERFDRTSVLAESARALGTDVDALEAALYADLRQMGVLSAFEAISPGALLDGYERGRAQAVLLRAVRVTLDVQAHAPSAARVLFRRLKFLGLLHTITAADGGYRIGIDGPLSLFDSVTRYGQKMAMLLPVLEGCGEWSLVADVRWGKERTPLTFRAAGGSRDAGAKATEEEMRQVLPEVAELAKAFRQLGTDWRVGPSRAVLDLPGTGLCIPDLVFTRRGQKIYLEVLGFWSREAVFRRVDLVRRGLTERILFAVSARLRVSEELLGDDDASALYVYKGTMSARALAERLERLARGATLG
jgi:predicted nuclease of restriction endonuclease-like RecB superfamily